MSNRHGKITREIERTLTRLPASPVKSDLFGRAIDLELRYERIVKRFDDLMIQRSIFNDAVARWFDRPR